MNILGISLKVAAGLVLIAVSIFVLRSRDTATPATPPTANFAPALLTFANTSAAPARVMLSDGSVVTLRPQSELKYPATFAGLREVYLAGEAFFEVKRDEHKPFYVYAHEVTTRVLGTSFLITAYNKAGHVTVSVKTGRVAVFKPVQDRTTPRTGQEVILTPNQQAVYNKGEDAITAQPVEQPAALVLPVARKIRYEAAPVIQVFEDLKQNYEVDLRYTAEDFKDYTLTTTLSAESLDNRIDIICKAIGASYQAQGRVITVYAHKPSNANPQP